LKRSKSSPKKAEKKKDVEVPTKPKPTPVVKKGKGSKKDAKGKSKEEEAIDEEEENSDLENAYLETHRDAPKPEDEEDVEEPLVHESLQKGKKSSRSGPKTKFVPSDETPERRDQRTIFIGNLSVEVAQKRVRCRILLCSLFVH
jgi:nucleolar protein 12